MSVRYITIFSIILFFDTLNYHLTYDNSIVRPSHLLFIFLNDTLRGVFLWITVERLLLFIRSHFHFYRIVQNAVVLSVNLFIAFCWTGLVSLLTGDSWIAPINLPLHYLIVGGMIMAIIINYSFWVNYFESLYKSSNSVQIQKGAEFINLSLNHIFWIELDEDLVYITNYLNEKSFADHTPREIMKIIDKNFFRVNQQLIIHYNAIAKFKEMGKEVVVYLNTKEEKLKTIPLEKSKANSFKKWWLKFQS